MVTKIFLAVIYFWHYFLGFLALSFLGQYQACKFTPSCSVYTAEAVEKFGVFKGLKLGIARLLKCQPFSKVGVK